MDKHKHSTDNKDFQNFDIGERIKEQRKKMHITQQELANKLGYSKEHIKKIENKDGTPTLDTVRNLKKIFGVTYDYLIDGKYESERITISELVEKFSQLSPDEKGEFLKLCIDLININRLHSTS